MTKRRLFVLPPARPELEALLKIAATHVMTPREIWDQRVSFVFGQMMDCAPGVTRQQVEDIAVREYGPRPA